MYRTETNIFLIRILFHGIFITSEVMFCIIFLSHCRLVVRQNWAIGTLTRATILSKIHKLAFSLMIITTEVASFIYPFDDSCNHSNVY